MYRELISKMIKGHRWAKIQPPCPEQDIIEAEQIVGFPFPEDLKNLLREANGDRELLWSAGEIIKTVELNRTYFTECFDDIEEYQRRVDRHIFFAGNGCGDYYCYRVLENSIADTSGIYIWEHETFESHYVAQDIADLIVRYYNGEI